jgi:hypothetical protein
MKNFLARFWFPLALIVLLVLALPGFLLFGLRLFGVEGPINRWLEGAYQLSYNLPIPWWGGALLLLVPFAVIALYFLKLKRKPLAVPSTFLWRKSIEDLHVNSLLQWLRQNVLLLLQLLVLLALIYGVLGFRFHGRPGVGSHYILMIDNSASMSASDVEPNRLEKAKEEALKAVDARTDQDVGMVIVFNSSAEIRQSYTTNRALLRDAVRRVEPTQRPTRIEEALSLADSLANPIRSTEDAAARPDDVEVGKERTYVQPKGTPTEVHLFSDGCFPDLTEAALAGLNSRLAGNESALGNLDLKYHMIGRPGPENVDNIGLVTLNGVRDDVDPTRLSVFARVLNFRPQDVTTRVRLEVRVNGALQKVYEEPVFLPARKVAQAAAGNTAGAAVEPTGPADLPGEGSATFDIPDVDTRATVTAHAQLVGAGDRFPLDDEAWLVLNAPRKARVLIVGAPNDALDKFFGSEEVLEAANVDRLEPRQLADDAYRRPARNGLYDLVLFDRCAPATEQDMPRSNTFFIGQPPPPWKRAQFETVSNPVVTGWMASHPLLRDLRALYTIGIGEAFRMKKEDLPPRTPLLIEGRVIAPARNVELPLLISLSRESFTDLVMTFPLLTDDGKWNTDFWIQVSFPLFLRKTLYQLGNLNENAIEEPVAPGAVKRLLPDASVRQVEVVGPDGRSHLLTHDDRDPRSDFSFGDTERLGVYQAKWGGAPKSAFAVNLLDADESNLEPRAVLRFGSDQVAAGQEQRQPRDLWKWFTLAALVVLLAEWYVYNRRVYV